MRHVVLLRAVNVGGRNPVAMGELRELLTNAGFQDVRTYLQSGNVVLGSDAAPEEVARQCERQLADGLGLDVAVVVRTRDELAEVVRLNPLEEVASDPKLYQVGFCSAEPEPQLVAKLAARASASERFVASGREFYAWYPDGSGRSKLAARTAKLGGGITVTARNWKTVISLLAIADE
jgi:uncharacterized protein (DUF1697 family)